MTRYWKEINGRIVIDLCRTIQTDEGVWISNPTEEQILAAGWQVYIPPEPPAPTPQTQPEFDAMMEAVRRMLDATVEELSDEEALEVAALFPTWVSKIGQAVNVGERYWYDGRLWKVVQAHTVQEDWTPDTAVSLFVEVSIEEWPELVVPIPSSNPYMQGDKVTYKGKHYICVLDNTVWTPDEYAAAWNLVE